ncbi:MULTISPECIES: hypothetical protein [Shouchella]|uniref:YceG-like family protein n=2 Tax=Shouchella TaxID=2893057 RepID=A0ABY7W6D4_9BACI|nr:MULTISPECIES: hypothetical protein [Shouchella]MED4127925.1 hypothetical protein [Shouchella miscanthi]WDF03071.1 hypothetical protein PQ477_16475 [Shouchella hunanensis]
MTRKTIRSFAGGLLIASGVLGITYFIGNDQEAVSSSDFTEEEMVAHLQENGYAVETQATWDELEAQLAEAQNTDAEEEPSDNNEGEIAYRTILHVVPGMTSIDVGEMLEEAGIVDSAYDFYEEVDNRGLSNDLRPQVTGELTSEMSLSEVVDEFF